MFFLRLESAPILAGLLFLLSQAATAQPVRTELLTLAFNGSLPGYYYKSGGQVLKLTASAQGISAPVFYQGPPLISLYEKESDLAPHKEGEEKPEPVLRVKLPPGNDRVLLVFAYTGTQKRIPGATAYGISMQSMKEGDYRIFNFSKQSIYAILNDKKTKVAPGKQSNVSDASWKREILDMKVAFGLQAPDQKARSVYSSVWGHRPVRRNFIFIFDRPDKFRPLDIRMFYDVPKIKAAR